MSRGRALAISLLLIGCGGGADELNGVPACKTWLEAVDACGKAAPTAMRESLEAMVKAVRESNRDAPADARLAETCTAAMARLDREAATLCPNVRWRAPAP